jgi:hypothetical protein
MQSRNELAQWLVLVAIVVVPSISAAANDVVLFVESGSARRPIARFDGERWSATCRASPGETAASVQPVRRVVAASAEWTTVQRAARDVFSRREREQRLVVQRLAAVPMTLDAVYASGAAASATYYFEASKRVEDTSPNADPDTDPAGVLTLRVTGWLQASNARPTPIASKADVEWHQLDRAPSVTLVDLVPIGTLRQADAIVWVMKREADTAATFILYKMRGSAVEMVLRSRC